MNKELRNILVFAGAIGIIFFLVFVAFQSKNQKEAILNGAETEANKIFVITEQTNESITNQSEVDKIYDSFSKVEEIHWTHMPLTYRVNFTEYNEDTIKSKRRLLEYALERIHNTIPYIEFIETTNESGDILFLGEIPTKTKVEMCNAGSCDLGGLTIPNYSGKYISSAVVYLPEIIKNDPDLIGAYSSDLEVHEILHTFGVGELSVVGGIMWESTSGAYRTIEEVVISCLKRIYSNGEYNGNCSKANLFKSCDNGFVLGNDNECHKSCGVGYVLGQDYECHRECGEGYYCLEGGECCGGQCFKCPEGSSLGSDCMCSPS